MPSLPTDFAIPARSSYASATYEDSITSKSGTGLLVFLRTLGEGHAFYSLCYVALVFLAWMVIMCFAAVTKISRWCWRKRRPREQRGATERTPLLAKAYKTDPDVRRDDGSGAPSQTEPAPPAYAESSDPQSPACVVCGTASVTTFTPIASEPSQAPLVLQYEATNAPSTTSRSADRLTSLTSASDRIEEAIEQWSSDVIEHCENVRRTNEAFFAGLLAACVILDEIPEDQRHFILGAESENEGRAWAGRMEWTSDVEPMSGFGPTSPGQGRGGQRGGRVPIL